MFRRDCARRQSVAVSQNENRSRRFIPEEIKSPHILVLMHNKEFPKWSNTGQIIFDVIPKEQRSLLIWNGRNDTSMVESAICELRDAKFTPILVWPDDGSLSPAPESIEYDARSYIILDGTWQQAQDMFRKGPASLRSLPRLSLSPTATSSYRLRGDFGYKERFGASRGLLCTAEAAAGLLTHAGAVDLAAAVLAALDSFQARFPPRPPRPRV
jgi:DTW domain-containing protein